MSIRGGFFNAINHDRTYTAEDFGRLFAGIITNGIVPRVGQEFHVQGHQNSTYVTVQSGRAMHEGLWIENDADYRLNLGPGENTSNRWDAIAIEFDRSTNVRGCSIVALRGTPRVSGHQKPHAVVTSEKHQYIIAYVERRAGENHTTRITDNRNSVNTPFSAFPDGTIRPLQLRPSTSFTPADAVVVGEASLSTEVAKRVTAKQLVSDTISGIHAANANLLYEDRNLGTAITSAHLEAIRSGRFNGLMLGNYWQLNGVKWRIVDFDYFYGRGATPPSNLANRCTLDKHHVVVMPDTSIASSVIRLHDSSSTNGGYLNFEFRRAGKPLSVAYQQTESMIGVDKLLSFPHYMWMSAQQGYPTSTYFQYERMVIPSLRNIMTASAFLIEGQQTSNHQLHFQHYNPRPFAAFDRNPQLLVSQNGGMWLSDIVSHNSVAFIANTGNVTHAYINMAQGGLRPYIAIG